MPVKNGGVLECKEKANFHFADCSADPDVLPLFNSEKYAKQELTVIRSDWIKGVVKVGNRRSSEVPLGEYILPHPSIADEIARFLKGYPGEIRSSKAPVTKARSEKQKAGKSYDPWAFTDEETETEVLPKRRRSREEDVEIFPREKDTSLPGPSQCKSNRYAITAARQLCIQGNNKANQSHLCVLQAHDSSQTCRGTTTDKVDEQFDKVAEPASSINDYREDEEEHNNENINIDQHSERKSIKTSTPRHFLSDYSEKATQSLEGRDQQCDQEGNWISPKKTTSSHNSKDNSSNKTSVVDVIDEYSDQKGITTRSKATSPRCHRNDDKIKKAGVKKVEDQHGGQEGIVNLSKMTVVVSPINHESQVMETRDEHGDLKRVTTGAKKTKMTSPRSQKRQGEDFGDQHRYTNEIMTRSKANSTSYDSKNKSIKETPLGETSQLLQQGISVKRSNSPRKKVCKMEETTNNIRELGSSSQDHMEKISRRVTRSVAMNTRSQTRAPKISSASGSFTTSMSGGYVHLEDLVLPDVELVDVVVDDVSKIGFTVSFKKT